MILYQRNMDAALLKGVKLALTAGKLTPCTPTVQRAKDIHRQYDCEEALQVDLVKTERICDYQSWGREGDGESMVTIWGCIS